MNKEFESEQDDIVYVAKSWEHAKQLAENGYVFNLALFVKDDSAQVHNVKFDITRSQKNEI